MSDDIKLDQDENKKPDDDKQLKSRRKFAKSGIAGGAVLMSLLSRPALGTGYNDPRCTGSIMASVEAGSSLHDFDPDDCKFGCTPGFWCGGAAGLAWLKIGQLTGGIHPGSRFSDVFPCAPGPQVFDDPEVFPQGGNTPLEEILCIPNRGEAFLKQSARHSIAAWLNANIMGSFFGPTPGQIVDGYCSRYEAWHANQGNAGLIADLEAWHQAMKNLNERGCPLDNDPNNMFYD